MHTIFKKEIYIVRSTTVKCKTSKKAIEYRHDLLFVCYCRREKRREAKINGDPGKKNTRACVYIVTQKYTARAR